MISYQNAARMLRKNYESEEGNQMKASQRISGARIRGVWGKIGILAVLIAVSLALAAIPRVSAALLYKPSSAANGSGLMAGVGIRDITPTSDMYPMTWGNGARGFVFIGAIERVFVRVVAVSNDGEDALADPTKVSLIVSFETGKGPYPPDMIALLSEETGVPEDSIFWTTTHTHSVPEITSANWAAALNNPITEDSTMSQKDARNKARWGVMLQKQLVGAARDAIGGMKEAEVSIGHTESYINVNRDTKYDVLDGTAQETREGYNGQGFSDKTLTVVEFRERGTEGKEPIAFIVHYAMHNVLLYANDYFNPAFNAVHGVTAAAPGDIAEGTYVEGDVDATVLSTVELNKAYSNTYEKNTPDMQGNANTAETAANAAIHPDIGGLVSKYIEKEYEGAVALWISGAAGDQNPLFRNTMNFESPYNGAVLEIPIEGGKIEPSEYYAAIQYADVLRALADIEAEGDFAGDAPIGLAWGRDSVDKIEGASGTVPIFLKVMRLGDITFAGVPFELFNAIGVAMRDESSLDDSVPNTNTLVVNHCWTSAEEDSYRSYYPDDVAIANKSNRWTDGVKYPEGAINGAMIDLLESVYEDAEP
jgi:hypothetical protein